MVILLLVSCHPGPDDSGQTPVRTHALPTLTGPALLGDLDGDGYSPLGGLDCDDADPEVHPGAIEACDTVDQDCDGNPWAHCGEVQPASDPYVLVAWPEPAWAAPVRDLTGDGRADLLLAGLSAEGVVVGGDIGRDGAVPTEAHRWYETYGAYSENLFDAGDVDGDGYNDIVISDRIELEALAIEFGPIPIDGEWTRLTNDAVIWQSPAEPPWTWGQFVSGGQDLDGDGMYDILVQRDMRSATNGNQYFDIFQGTTRRTPEIVTLTTVESLPVAGTVTSDLDGDGAGDVLLSPGGAARPDVLWLSGAVMSASDGAFIEDVASGSFDSAGTGHQMTVSLDWYAVGDWNEDGRPDVVGIDDAYTAAEPTGGNYHGRVAYYGAVNEGRNESLGSIVGDGELLGSCARGTPWLYDEDGAGGLLCFNFGGDYINGTLDTLVIYPPRPVYGTVGFSDVQHFETRSNTLAGIELEMPIGGPDVTGDGLGDVAMFGTDGVYVIPGFELPWGDASAW